MCRRYSIIWPSVVTAKARWSAMFDHLRVLLMSDKIKITNPVILFDGVCNFCNGTVNFLIRQDKKKKLRFAALQSEAGQRMLEEHHLPAHDFDSFILVENSKVYKSSTAALRVAMHLRWYWKWAQIFWILPAFIRNALYNVIARNRYKWFGRKEACMIPTPEVKERFL